MIVFGVLTVALLTGGLMLFIYRYGQTDRADRADVIIILGAGTRVDGTPNRPQTRRVRHAATLYQRGIAPYLLCTGGLTDNHPKSEAQTCIDLLRSLGIPESAILSEHISTNTMENVIESRKVMDAARLRTAVVVSDDFHLFRAEWLFHEYSMTVSVSPAQATQGRLSYVTAASSTFREVGSLFLNAWRIVSSDYRQNGLASTIR